MSNDNGVISFENMKRMEARRAKVDEVLLQAAGVQQMADHTTQLISEIKRQQRIHLNKHVYDLAERLGVSIYDICLQYMPKMSEPQFSHADDGTVTYEQDIRLVPMPFEPDKGPDYWEEECRRLKERMQELINNMEDWPMTAWQWHETDKRLPEITNGDGTSDYVLGFPGSGCLPKVVKYSDGSYTKRGWWTTDFKHLSLKTGGRCNARQRFPYWSPIELPTFERLLKQTKEE